METMHGSRMERLIVMYVRISWTRKQASNPNRLLEPSICDSIPGGISGLQNATYTPQFLYLYDV
jgi:hypothetical protein